MDLKAATATFLVVAIVARAASGREKPDGPREPPTGTACISLTLSDRINAVTEAGEIKLSSGRLVRLAGLRRPEDPALIGQASAWLEWHRGSAVEVAAVRSEPDRWGRLPAIVTVVGDAGPIDLGRSLVAAGLAVVDPGEEDGLCQPGLLATEQRAREGGLGLWREERYRPVAASDFDRLDSLVGRFAVVEGRIRSVGERAQRTYLNFGRDWSKALTITIPKRTWRKLLDGGVSAAGLQGRRIRARGVVERWRGPTIAVTAPELMEILDEGAPGRR
jgi:endonuclease YncB( thermonuclease family)